MAKDEPRIIKRYANRKLYDTELRRFTTLDDLSRLLDKGVRFVVRDHDSGDDRTDDILAQVLGKRVRGGGGVAGGTDLLSGLLRAPTQIAQQLIGEQESTEAKPKKKKKKKGGAKDGKSGATDKAGKGAKPKKAKHPADVDAQEQEIEELRSQVAELTQAVSMLVNEKLAEREAAAGAPEDDDEE